LRPGADVKNKVNRTVELDASLTQKLQRDEIVKIRPGQSECSHIITGSGFSQSSVSQNLENGQSEESEATLLGVLQGPQKCGDDVIYSGLPAIWEFAYGI
jgi:hypothetical protein